MAFNDVYICIYHKYKYSNKYHKSIQSYFLKKTRNEIIHSVLVVKVFHSKALISVSSRSRLRLGL